MSFGFAPKGWALCNGQLLPISRTRRHAYRLCDRKLTPGGGFLNSAWPF
ncbi:MAG: tail fiber protein [Gammaproteobacteria bacterium]